MAVSRHSQEHPVPPEAMLSDDPDLALVHAQMASYFEPEPCAQEACESEEACTCDGQGL